MSTNNYKLNCRFGPHAPGDVLPAHMIEVGHDHKLMLERGLIEPTGLPVTVLITAPEPVAQKAPDTLEAERDRLVEENKGLRGANQTATAVAKELETQRDGFKNKCGEYTDKIVHLETACESHQNENEKLVAELAVEKGQIVELEKANAELTAEVTRLTGELEKAQKAAKKQTKASEATKPTDPAPPTSSPTTPSLLDQAPPG